MAQRIPMCPRCKVFTRRKGLGNMCQVSTLDAGIYNEDGEPIQVTKSQILFTMECQQCKLVFTDDGIMPAQIYVNKLND